RDATAAVLDLIEMRRPLSASGAGAVHVKEMMEVPVPERVRAARDRERLRVGLAHDHEAGEPQHRGMRRLERGAVALHPGTDLSGKRMSGEREAGAAGGLRSVGTASSRPKRRMRLLERLELDRHVGIVVKFAVERERPPR